MTQTHYIVIHLRGLFILDFFFFYLKYLCPTYHKVEGRERREKTGHKKSQILRQEAWLQGLEQVLLLSGNEGSWTR